MRTAISFGDLDLLAGEVLPERTVLSTLVTPFSNPGADADGGGSSSAAAAAAGGGNGDNGGGTTVVSGCVNQQSQATSGLVGALGLGTPQQSSQTCTPVSTVSGH